MMIMNKQFEQDVSRMTIFINGQLIANKDPKKVWDLLSKKLGNDNAIIKSAVPYFTLDCMSDLYIDESLNLGENEFLVSSPNHIVRMTIDNQVKWTIEVTRYLRLTYVSNYGESWDLDLYKFTIFYSSMLDSAKFTVDKYMESIDKMGKSAVLTEGDFHEYLQN